MSASFNQPANCFTVFGGPTAGFSGQSAGFTGGQSASYFNAPASNQAVSFSAASYPVGTGVQGEQYLGQSGSSSSGSLAGETLVGGQVTSPYHGAAASGTFDASAGSVGSSVSTQRRQGRVRQQVIRLPDQAQGQVRQVRHRMPTPEPDTLERV